MAWRDIGLAEFIERMPLAFAVTRLDGRLEYANPQLRALLGASGPDGLLDRPLPLRRLGGRAPSPLEDKPRRAESLLCAQDGEQIQVAESACPVRDARGELAYVIHFFEDLRGQKRAEQLRALALHDPLTGLPNRNLLHDRLARALLAARRSGGGFALLYIDIDKFKTINDTRGHAAGDLVLQEFARRACRALRKSDSIARLGGDEFVVILEDTRSHAAAAAVAEKLFAACRGRYELKDCSVQLTFSLGIGIYPDDARDASALLDHADKAMYQAKSQGRNCYSLVPAPYGLAADEG
ncbi:MAG TPA: sensor domain-containing diguanylate cyclase [Burkholderiales bacterium]|nr:sensor domain-containing diguanylate cyclase [Burkholderiales bacterium]